MIHVEYALCVSMYTHDTWWPTILAMYPTRTCRRTINGHTCTYFIICGRLYVFACEHSCVRTCQYVTRLQYIIFTKCTCLNYLNKRQGICAHNDYSIYMANARLFTCSNSFRMVCTLMHFKRRTNSNILLLALLNTFIYYV